LDLGVPVNGWVLVGTIYRGDLEFAKHVHLGYFLLAADFVTRARVKSSIACVYLVGGNAGGTNFILLSTRGTGIRVRIGVGIRVGICVGIRVGICVGIRVGIAAIVIIIVITGTKGYEAKTTDQHSHHHHHFGNHFSFSFHRCLFSNPKQGMSLSRCGSCHLMQYVEHVLNCLKFGLFVVSNMIVYGRIRINQTFFFETCPRIIQPNMIRPNRYFIKQNAA
jgi:hypothetical protein